MKKCILLLFCLPLIFCACSEDEPVNPKDVDLETLWINAKQGSFWRYVNVNYLLSGTIDTFNSPFDVYKMEKDSFVNEQVYEMIGLDLGSGVIAPKYIYAVKDRILIQPHDIDLSPNVNMVELPIIDFNKNLGEEWQFDVNSNEYQINYIDSVGISFRGFDNVVKVISRAYLNDELQSTQRYYLKPDLGIISKITKYEVSGILLDVNLIDYEVNY